jgi:drug/metabolite transporter (DMT)-like permease
LAMVLGIVVAHERLASATFVGSAAVLGGIWLVNAPGPAD